MRATAPIANPESSSISRRATAEKQAWPPGVGGDCSLCFPNLRPWYVQRLIASQGVRHGAAMPADLDEKVYTQRVLAKDVARHLCERRNF